MESSRTALASRTYLRTHFEVLVLGLQDQVLGLEASSPQKLPCPRLEDSTVFWIVKMLMENAENLAENVQRPFLFSSLGDRLKIFLRTFFWDRLKKGFGDRFSGEHLRLCLWSLPWPRVHLSFALAWNFFFCVLGLCLEPCVLDSTSDNKLSLWGFCTYQIKQKSRMKSSVWKSCSESL